MGKDIKARNQRKIILITLIVIFAFVGILAYSKSGILNGLLVAQDQSQETKTFQSSSVLKFSITIPAKYEASEYLGSVTVSADNKGKILIGRSGTNFSDLSSYLGDLNIKNKVEVVDEEPLLINGYEASKQKMTVSGESRVTYFIFVNNFVYSISTTSESLYDDLDQIAQSFKYTGE